MTGYTEQADAELVALLQIGDHDAFQELHTRYAAIMYKSALSILGDQDLAEDVVQDVFCILWEKRESLNVINTISGYIYGITRFTALAHIKKSKNYQRYLTALQNSLKIAESPDQMLIQREKTQQVEYAIRMLPCRMQEILILVRTGSQSYREIAAMLGITENRVKNSVSEAVKVLRTKVQLLMLTLP